jgi:hypothetical protein
MTVAMLAIALAVAALSAPAQAQPAKKPNILVIWATTSGPGTSATTTAA